MMIKGITGRNIRFLLAGSFLLAAHSLSAQQGSAFHNGFARMEESGKSWYIDSTGKKAFDQIVALYHPAAATAADEEALPEAQETMLLVSSAGKTGIVAGNGKWLLPPVYDTIELKWKTCLVLRQQGKMTYADTDGKLLLPLQFEDAGILDDTHFDVKTGGKWGIYSTAENRLLIPAMYESFDYCGGCGRKGDYLFAQKNGKWGIIDFNNNVLMPFEYEHAHAFMRSDNWVQCFKKQGHEVTINLKTKKEYTAPEYTDMTITGNSLLKAQKNGKYGLINEDGVTIADFIYDDITDAYGETERGPYLQVTKNGKTGILREDGKVMIAPVYEGDITGSGDYFIIRVDGNYNLTDTTGKKLLAKDYTEITFMDKRFSAPLVKLKQKALYGFYNPVNRKVVAPAFFDIDRTTVTAPGIELLEVSYQEMYGLYDAGGEQVLPVAYKKLDDLVPGLVAVKKETGTGVYDIRKKKMLIPAVYNSISVSSADSSLFLASQSTPEGSYKELFFNHNGVKMPAPKVPIVPEKKSQMLEKETANGGYPLYGYTNSTGKVIVPPIYDRLLVEKNGRGFLAQTGGKFTVLNEAGQPVSKQLFDDIALEEVPRYGSAEVLYSFPLLCRTGDTYQYVTATGSFLPVKVTGIVAFSAYSLDGIPEL